jgi:hypothetical protein
VRKAALKTTEAVDPPVTSIFTPDTEFGSRFLIEVVRGCANLCRFCWAGYNYLPVRAFPTERILQLAAAAKPYSNRAGLVSIALCDHPDIEEILTRLTEMGYSISPASLRLDDLTPQILDLLRASGERTVTIAPEVGIGSASTGREQDHHQRRDPGRHRDDLRGGHGEPEALLHDRDPHRDRRRSGGHPRSDPGDARHHDAARQGPGHVGRIVGSVNPLVPKPGTAYQWLPMEDDASIDRKIKRLRSLTADIENVYFNIKSERHSFYQALLSLGDRRVAPAIEAAERNGGNWRAAVKEAGVDADFYVFRDRSADPVLPWDIIDGGMKDSFFRAEMAKATREEWTLPPKRQKDNARLLTVLS